MADKGLLLAFFPALLCTQLNLLSDIYSRLNAVRLVALFCLVIQPPLQLLHFYSQSLCTSARSMCITSMLHLLAAESVA